MQECAFTFTQEEFGQLKKWPFAVQKCFFSAVEVQNVKK